MELIQSKKFQTAIIAVIVMLVGEFGFDLDANILLAIVSPFVAYIVGQGIADHGKEKVLTKSAIAQMIYDKEAE